MNPSVWADRLFVFEIEGVHAGKWISNGHWLIRADWIDKIDNAGVLAHLPPGRYDFGALKEVKDTTLESCKAMLAGFSPDHPELELSRWQARDDSDAGDETPYLLFITKAAPWRAVGFNRKYEEIANVYTATFRNEANDKPIALWNGERLIASVMPVSIDVRATDRPAGEAVSRCSSRGRRWRRS